MDKCYIIHGNVDFTFRTFNAKLAYHRRNFIVQLINGYCVVLATNNLAQFLQVSYIYFNIGFLNENIIYLVLPYKLP